MNVVGSDSGHGDAGHFVFCEADGYSGRGHQRARPNFPEWSRDCLVPFVPTRARKPSAMKSLFDGDVINPRTATFVARMAISLESFCASLKAQ